jgi:hypothetical protein
MSDVDGLASVSETETKNENRLRTKVAENDPETLLRRP